MGQPITVTARPGASPSIRFFELNRSLTGMEIEIFKEVMGDDSRLRAKMTDEQRAKL